MNQILLINCRQVAAENLGGGKPDGSIEDLCDADELSQFIESVN
jgi:hypothetical protein